MSKKKFEYKTIVIEWEQVNFNYQTTKINELLNQQGNDGWKLLEFRPENFGIVCIWEREVTN